ncbi:MAG: hypothetical protein HY423_11495 [Candidatus Lambdaproteobacteria bacterium]|nr:hypothetical protein [Candidatus Lambdaproteobacteria bacterium]
MPTPRLHDRAVVLACIARLGFREVAPRGNFRRFQHVQSREVLVLRDYAVFPEHVVVDNLEAAGVPAGEFYRVLSAQGR